MVKQKATFTFSQEAIKEPVIYTLSQQFNVITNIRRADLSDDKGWVMLEMEGRKEDIEQGIAWATSKGVRVDLMNIDSMES